MLITINSSQLNARPHSGFSLFEMLIVISILGIIVSLALPIFSTTEASQKAANKRNAQTICSVATAANAAGVAIASGTSDIVEVLRRLSEGVTVTRGPLSGRVFRVPAMSTELLNGASKFITLSGDGELIYDSKGSNVRSM